jgi:MFS family permease
MKRKIFEKLEISMKDFLLIFILLVNAFVWLFISPTIISQILEGITLTEIQDLMIGSAFYGSIVISSVIGSILTGKISRFKMIYTWIIIGIIASMVPLFYSCNSWIDGLSITILIGATFGIGLPSCLSYFADTTKIENRGRISGLILLGVYLASPILVLLLRELDLQANLIIFSGWRFISLIALFLQSDKKVSILKIESTDSFSRILTNKTFGFYSFAWIMFCLADIIGQSIALNSLGELSNLILITNPILVTITALIGGIVTDWIGRKKIVIYAFLSLGVSYALIGLAPKDPLVGYFFIVINGLNTGLFFVLFIFIIWGDISQSGSREKYYTLGGIPYFLTGILGILLDKQILNIPATSIFSASAFFLFLAVIPLLYAPDTLPEKKMELRRLRSFADDAKKMREKYENKI